MITIGCCTKLAINLITLTSKLCEQIWLKWSVVLVVAYFHIHEVPKMSNVHAVRQLTLY